MKKLFVLSAMCIVTMLFTNKAMSQVVASGTTGSCTWELTGPSGNYTLTISGTGAMGDYDIYIGSYSPWNSYQNDITTLDLQQGVTTIGAWAFYSCSGLTSVTIPNSVTSIREGAFAACSGLTSVTIPNLVTSIGNSAFSFCSGLTSVTIPNSVTTIGGSAFYSCSGLTSIDVDASNPNYSSVNGVLFNKLQDKLIQYPSGKTGDYTIPNSVTSIAMEAFASCSSLSSVTIPNSVTTIGAWAFYSCSGLTSVTIPNSVTSIGSSAFSSCSGLTSVTIPNSVTSIGSSAFFYCSGLISVTIPNSVTSIEYAAFGYCIGLTALYVKAQTPPVLGYNAFEDVPAAIPVYVPCGTASAYQSASGWSSFSNYIEEDTHLTVESNDATMGTATIIQSNSCTDNTAIIQAVSNQGYSFVQWHDGDTQNPRTITVTQDITYTAIFEIIDTYTYTVTVLANYAERGTVTGSGDYPQDSTATITATANSGYHFVEWNDGNTDNPREFTVTRDTIFTAIFDITNAIEDMAISTISIYPNPATDNIHIVLPEHALNALFTLYDMQGKALIRKEISNRDVISVSGLAAGIYVYSVRTATMNYTGKVVKE